MQYITNPNINIVFVRIVGANSKGLRQATGEATVYNALDWVLRNKDRLNIQAVSMSQSQSNSSTGVDYCNKTPITENKIKALMNAGIPTFSQQEMQEIILKLIGLHVYHHQLP
ncbi:MAG UNVERIFIED_CONTAM: hypothetical protein LVQ98_07880 [Rickettsiaceae bacterium]